MPRTITTLPCFRKTVLALAAGAVLMPTAVWALDLTQGPPGTTEPYVRPNVIISIDDSGSMNYRLDRESSSGTTNQLIPNLDGSWPVNARRMNVLKYSLGAIFDPTHPEYDTSLLPDKKIRVAWQAMHNNGKNSAGASPDANTVNDGSMRTNSMRVLEGAQRSNIINFVKTLSASSATPSHLMFSQADAYMRRNIGVNSPFASDPGNTGAPYLACRRNYHIMMTDGRWNGTATAPASGSQDNNKLNKTLPDGTVFGSTNAATRPKNDLYHDEHTKTLADWAFYSWSNPLQTSGLTGAMQPAADYRKAPTTENFGNDSAGQPAILDRYWNPRYNPATWPHMVTYTIGFSNVAVEWKQDYADQKFNIAAPMAQTPFGFDGSFADLVTGNKSWPAMGAENIRALDLWHAALNGRGRFYAVTKGEDLQKAFREIFEQIKSNTEPAVTSTAASGTNATLNEVGKFTGAYEPQNNWKGFVIAETVKPDGTIVATPGWGGLNTAQKLDAPSFSVDSRFVLSWGDKKDFNYKDFGGVPFKWSSDESRLSAAQKLSLQKSNSGANEGATRGEQRLNYIRGARALEGSDVNGYTAAKPFRERLSRQGDIVNSVVWYTGAPSSNYALKGYAAFTLSKKNRPPMLYVGGNDGMLHGFSADDGSEKIAYVPKGVMAGLNQLTAPGYNDNHRFYVDGSAMTGDVDTGIGIQDPNDPAYSTAYAPNWRTMLVGTLGAGGKGYFVLDVSNPTSVAETDGSPAFVEGNASTLVKLDRTIAAAEPAPDCVTGLSGAQKFACNRVKDENDDLGHITARPVLDSNNNMRTTQITRMNDNRWAVVLGNGINSRNQRPVLLIQYLDGNQELLRIPATVQAPGIGFAADNGLAAPRLVDLNGDERPDVVYAGDHLGNIWKFDITDLDSSQWRVAFSSNPLFTARGPASLTSASRTKIQPITIAPTVRPNDRKKIVGTGANAKKVPVGGMMVAFGTGRNITKGDEASVDVQTLYSVLDNTRYKEVTTSLGKRLQVHLGAGTCPAGADCVPAPQRLGTGVVTAKLSKQSVTELGATGFATVDVVDDLKLETWADSNGWYMDLPAVGERALKPMEFYDGSNLLAVWTQVPAKGSNVDPNVESCESSSVDGERQFRTLINIMDGKRPSVQLVDSNHDGIYSAGSDQNVSRVEVAEGSHTLITKGDRIIDVNNKNEKEELARLPEQPLRPTWRQLH